MTHKRLNKLLIAAVCLLTVLLLCSVWARASGPVAPRVHLAGYVNGIFNSGTGYNPGVGLMGEGSVRWNFLEAVLSGNARWQSKRDASFGYTWAANGQLRGFVWESLYLVGAWNWAGYKSIFESGAVWTKNGMNWGLGAGWHDNDMDVNLVWYAKEHASPNNVAFVDCNLRCRIWEWLWGMGSIRRQTFDQMVGGEMERLSGWVWQFGLGVRW